MRLTTSLKLKNTFLAFAFSIFLMQAQANQTLNEAMTPKSASVVIDLSYPIDLNNEVVDFTGEWKGTRFQYTDDRQDVLKEFEYVFNLKQEGSYISGVSIISSSEGEYAVIRLKGYVVADKLHFMEYRIDDETKRDAMTWCYKIGELQLSQTDEAFVMHGPTNSYTSQYYLPCSGGFTLLEKVKTSELIVTEQKESVNSIEKSIKRDMFDITAYPNPYMESVNLTYSLSEDANVKLEVYDMSGHRIQTIVNTEQTAGIYNFVTGGNVNGFVAGAYVVRLQVNDKVYSKQIIQSR